MADKQLSIEFSRASRDAAMRAVASGAEKKTPGWGDVAFSFLSAYASRHELFSAEDATTAAKARGIVSPTDARAWGPVYMRAARERLIERSTVTYQRQFGHSSLGLKWRSLICQTK